MYGAILGDMIGSPYEFVNNFKTKNFELFTDETEFTDDTIMTIAIADALTSIRPNSDDYTIKKQIIECMHTWGNEYSNVGFGHKFFLWIIKKDTKPYGSWGNGSAMRVSSVGWLFDSLEETRRYARLTAEVTHNHPEGIKGAEATASAIFLARTGKSKSEIKDYIISEFGYDLSQTCDQIRQWYKFDESCQGTVPMAITAFLEGSDFEDAIRNAVSLGGDADTLACITGGIAEAYYDIPKNMIEECKKRLPLDAFYVIFQFNNRKKQKIKERN